MKLVVGLGNPGLKYNNTRHNVGFVVVDSIARQLVPGGTATVKFDALVIESQFEGDKIMLMKPQQFMNKSGHAIQQAISFYKASPATDLLVIVDDIHLPCGTIRLRDSGSSGGHNGITDITNHLQGDQWARLRIGVDEPGVVPQSDYVLGKFTPEQQEAIEPACTRAVSATTEWLRNGIDEAMNKFNETQNSETMR